MNGADRYPVEVFYSDEDGGFIALARDLPGCSAFGKTQAEAVSEIQNAIVAWIESASAAKNPIPQPSAHADEALPSGRLLVRIPRTLHASLIDAARKDGVSLNQYICYALSFGGPHSFLKRATELVQSMRAHATRVYVFRERAHRPFDQIHVADNTVVEQTYNISDFVPMNMDQTTMWTKHARGR